MVENGNPEEIDKLKTAMRNYVTTKVVEPLKNKNWIRAMESLKILQTMLQRRSFIFSGLTVDNMNENLNRILAKCLELYNKHQANNETSLKAASLQKIEESLHQNIDVLVQTQIPNHQLVNKLIEILNDDFKPISFDDE